MKYTNIAIGFAVGGITGLLLGLFVRLSEHWAGRFDTLGGNIERISNAFFIEPSVYVFDGTTIYYVIIMGIMAAILGFYFQPFSDNRTELHRRSGSLLSIVIFPLLTMAIWMTLLSPGTDGYIIFAAPLFIIYGLVFGIMIGRRILKGVSWTDMLIIYLTVPFGIWVFAYILMTLRVI